MRRVIYGVILAALLCMMVISAQASQMINIYLDKDALLAHEAPAAGIRIRPEGIMGVTRHSLWSWDEEGAQWTLFVELENTSNEKIVIDDTWLVACKANRDEIAAAEYVFQMTDNVLEPGERTVLHAGVEPWRMPTDYHDVTDFEEVIGLSTFAGKIRRAEILRVRMDTRGNESTQNWPGVDVPAKVWIEDGKIRFELKNETEEPMAFRTIGVLVSDRDGQLMDVMTNSFARGAQAEPGGLIVFEKELQPYITNEMTEGAQFEIFAYGMNRE